MKKPKVSIVIPVYKPEKEVFDKLKEMLKKQTIKAEVIENWNMPEAKSMNTGIKKAKGEIIITLAQDCIPEDEFWLEKLIKPLEDENVVATVSNLRLPEKYWKTYSFFIRMFTLPDRRIRKPMMDARACAYRKEDIEKAGLFDEDPKVIGIEVDLSENLKKIGKIVHPNINVIHMHKYINFKKIIDTIYNYSKGNGKAVKDYGLKLNDFWQRFIRAIPFLGIVSIVYRFPFEKYGHLFPLYMFFIVPINHIINIFGFWKGLLSKPKEESRNIIKV